jgi:hypothetical protein
VAGGLLKRDLVNETRAGRSGLRKGEEEEEEEED